ncbi:MAG: flagellar motor protein MotB [Calditrichota bacterium]
MSGTDHHDEAPVIRIVKKTSHGGHHGGAWKVAYADFVTAMMALFIVLWILGQDESVQKQVAAYFRDPTGKSLVLSGQGLMNKSNQMGMRNAQGVDPSMINMRDDPLRTLEEEADNLRMMIQNKPDLQKLAGQINIEVTPEGVRVEINESQTEALFETGSAKLSPALTSALQTFGQEFAKLGSPIVVEGHTDSAPYSAASSMTNWELSTYRANEARRVMMESGLPDRQIVMVRGFADRKPRFKDQSDPRNRRISMLLLSSEGIRIAMGQNGQVPRTDSASTQNGEN